MYLTSPRGWPATLGVYGVAMAELGRRLRAPRIGRRAALLITFGFLASATSASIATVLNPTPAPVAAGAPLRVTAWAPYWEINDALAGFNANSSQMAELTPFFWSATSATTIVRNSGVTTAKLNEYRQAAANAGKPFVGTIVDGMPAKAMAAVLADAGKRTQHVQAVVAFAQTNGLSGVDIDYEQFAFADGRSSWFGTYGAWGAFLEELGVALHGVGKTLAVSVPPVYDAGQTSNSGYWVYNYAAIAQHVDKVRIMTYSYSGNAAGVISPYWWVEKSMIAAKAIVPADKIEMGIASYGTDVVSRIEGTCPKATTVKQSRSITHEAAAQFAADKGVVPTRVEREATGAKRQVLETTFDYVESFAGPDSGGNTVRCNVHRTVWYPDQQAINQRILLANSLGLGGIAMWSLGYEDAVTWQAIAAGRANTEFAQPAPIAPSVKAPAVVAPYPAVVGSPISPLPSRFLDTRSGGTTTDGLSNGIGRRGPGSITELQIAGRGTVPADATAVTLNVTVIGEGTGFVTVYPCGDRPTTSNLNVRAGQFISNTVITRLSETGTVCLFNQSAAHLVVDVFNVLADSTFDPVDSPARLLETRAGLATVDGLNVGGGAAVPGTVLRLQVAGRGGVSNGARTAVLNVTAADGALPGFITVWPCDSPVPSTSNVNYPANTAIPNAVITGLAADGTACISVSSRVNVIVDAFGELPDASYRAVPIPSRLLDTRVGGPTIDGGFSGDDIKPAGSVTELQVTGRGGVSSAATTAVLNVTVTGPQLAGFITVYPCGEARPFVSNVNYAVNQTLPNLVVTELTPTGTVCIFNSSATHIVVDVFGELKG